MLKRGLSMLMEEGGVRLGRIRPPQMRPSRLGQGQGLRPRRCLVPKGEILLPEIIRNRQGKAPGAYGNT